MSPTIKKEYDINKGIKLYGRDLPEDDITCKNLYITHNFSSTKFFKESMGARFSQSCQLVLCVKSNPAR